MVSWHKRRCEVGIGPQRRMHFLQHGRDHGAARQRPIATRDKTDFPGTAPKACAMMASTIVYGMEQFVREGVEDVAGFDCAGRN